MLHAGRLRRLRAHVAIANEMGVICGPLVEHNNLRVLSVSHEIKVYLALHRKAATAERRGMPHDCTDNTRRQYREIEKFETGISVCSE